MNFFSKFFKKSSSKEDSKKSESKFLPKKKAVIEERFILKFIENGGKFLYCEDLDEVQDNFNLILKENEWVNDDILIINSDLKKTYNLNNTFSSSLDETKCFVTDCENLIANDGSILISSNQIHEKKLNEFPQSLIILSDTRKTTRLNTYITNDFKISNTATFESTLYVQPDIDDFSELRSFFVTGLRL